MDAQSIDNLTYAEFENEFSVGNPRGEFTAFYAAPNEDEFNHVVKRIKQELEGRPIYYMGIIGGVDMNFNYISQFQPEMSFLFDIARKPVAYLGLRLALLNLSECADDYYLKFMCADDSTRQDFLNAPTSSAATKIIRDSNPDPEQLAEQGRQVMRILGYEKETEVMEQIMYNPQFRKESAAKSMDYFYRILDKGEIKNAWVRSDSYLKLKGLSEQGRIRAFSADFFSGFSQSAARLTEAYDIKNLVVYLSNVPEMFGFQKRKGTGPITDRRTLNEKLTDAFKPWVGLLDRVWIIDSKHSRNKIIENKNYS